MRSQSAGVSCELSTLSRSTTSASSPDGQVGAAVRRPQHTVGVGAGGDGPAGGDDDEAGHAAIMAALAGVMASAIGDPAMALGNDGGVTDETTGDAEPVTEAGTSRPAAAPRRLRLLLSVAGVVLALDVVTKVLAVKLLTPGQPVSIIGDTVTWTLVRNSGAAFSMATGYTWVLTLVALGVVIGIIWMGRRLVSPWWASGWA